MSSRLLLPLVLAAAFVADRPEAAQAVDATGSGFNVDHVRNVPYPDVREPEEVNAGSDLELTTLTVAPGTAPVAPDAPAGTSNPAAQPTAKTPGAPQTAAARGTTARKHSKRLAAARKAQRRTCAAARRAKGAKRKRLQRRCATARRKVTRLRKAARAHALDADGSLPGVQRTFAFAGSFGDGLQIIDVTAPEQAERVATWDCGISQGDVQLFRRDDLGGRVFATFTADDGYTLHEDSACVRDLRARGFEIDPEAGGTFIADVTDPYAPQTVSYVRVAQGSHNQTVHPSGRWLYNSNADLITSLAPAIELIDISDPTAPRVHGELKLQTFPGLGTEAHDITFSPDGNTAWIAALSHGEILDTSDPANPQRTGTIVDPSLNVWHQMEGITVGDRQYVIAEDEVAGALATGQCPNGGVHVYDATGPLAKAPVPVGYWNISDVGLTQDGLGICTAHVFQIDHEQDLMTIAFYNGGVRVVDVKDVVGAAFGGTGVGMKELGSYRFPDSNTWAVKAAKMDRKGFFLFGNDHRRGFDVYRYTPGQAPAQRGRWLTAPQVAAATKRFLAGGGKTELLALCLLGAAGKA